MNLFNNSVTNFAAFALALALSASHANAQKATFTLPFEAHWGSTILQPGEYTLEPPSPASVFPVFLVSGNGKSVLLGPSTIAYATGSQRNCLAFVNIGGAYFVRKFDFGATGKAFDFNVPRGARHQRVAKAEGTVAVIDTTNK